MEAQELLTMLKSESYNASITSRVPVEWVPHLTQKFGSVSAGIRELIKADLVRESGAVQGLPCIHSSDLPGWVPPECQIGRVVINSVRESLFAMRVGYSDDGKLTGTELTAIAAPLAPALNIALNPYLANKDGVDK